MAFEQCLQINMSEHECAVNLGSNHTYRSAHLSHHVQPDVTSSSASVSFYLHYTMSWKLPTVQLPTWTFLPDINVIMHLSLFPCVLHAPQPLFTPCSRILLEKLTGSQPVKKFPEFYGTRKFITAFTTTPHLFLSCYTLWYGYSNIWR